jgi:hypothetical protein
MAITITMKKAKTKLFLRLIQVALPRTMKASIIMGNTMSCGNHIIRGYSWPKANMAGRGRGLRRPEKIPAPFILDSPLPIFWSK